MLLTQPHRNALLHDSGKPAGSGCCFWRGRVGRVDLTNPGWPVGAHDVQLAAAVPVPKGLIICIPPSAAESSAMAPQRHPRSIDKFPPGGPADWIADGHVTCNIQCRCDRRMVDIRLDTLPQDQPWSVVGRRLVCKQCGAAGSVNIAPNWHDRAGHAVPFTRHWKT